jgi:hypothetical protein
VGEGSAAKVEEIEVIRGRLDEELAELDRRLPGPSGLARRGAAFAAGGLLVVGGIWLLLRRARFRSLAGRAEGMVARLPEAIGEQVGEKIALPLAHVNRSPWLMATTAAGVVTGLAEVAALRRLERALLRRPSQRPPKRAVTPHDRPLRSAWPPPRPRG